MKSLSNCSRFALKSGERMVRPVVFPPGRASEGMSPIPSMSSLLATIGIVEVPCWAMRSAKSPAGCLVAGGYSASFATYGIVSPGIARSWNDRGSRDFLIELRYAQNGFQQLPELVAELVRMKVDVISTNHAYPRLLLRARRERPSTRCAAEKSDELAPLHSITSSARTSNEGGMVSPRAFAAARFIGKSNLDCK